MLKRTITITTANYLKLRYRQLLVIDPQTKEQKGSIPIEDIALLIIDHPQVTITSQLMEVLMEETVAVIQCDSKHMPNGLMLPLQGNSTLTQKWQQQISASSPLKKQLWKQIIIRKIENQHRLLQLYQHDSNTLLDYAAAVKPGDTSNLEGLAAKYYWKHYLPNFKRNPEGGHPNNLLNYGYAILRSIVARSCVASGQLPALGIKHSNKYNAYCLADDLMEPYRPFVDKLVLEYCHKEETTDLVLNKNSKQHLLKVMTQDVFLKKQKRPLSVAISSTTASLQHCYAGDKRNLTLPSLLSNE